MEKRGSIKNRVIKNFMFLIVVTVLFIEVLVVGGIKHYYYKNIEELLTNQLNFSVEYLVKYLEINNIQDIVMNDIDLFWNQTTAQIQLYNKDGDLLLDSSGVDFSHGRTYSDVERALNGDKGVRISTSDKYKGEIISVSQPITQDDEVVGVLRFTSSMEETRNIVRNISMAIISVGIIVIITSGILSIFLANDIVKPIKYITDIAEKMAEGDLEVKSMVDTNDEIGKLSDTLNYMSEEILKREEVKNDFISSISHELKTPLTSIKGWAITLQYEEDINKNEIVADGLKIIENESDRLYEMLESLLDFSRFLSGDIKLKREEINIDNVVKSTYKQLLPTADINNIELKLEIEEVGLVNLDKNRLRQILINLLDNAFKFTENGVVKIKLFKEEDKAVIKIIDNGAGIDEKDLPHITEKFYKGETGKSNAGIGLSVVKEIIDLHKGELDIKSKVGEGTEITIKIPMGEIV